jgi:hypothetical protein
MLADYVWEEVYAAAILETDDTKLPNRLHVAKAAIDDRLHELQLDHGGSPEEMNGRVCAQAHSHRR